MSAPSLARVFIFVPVSPVFASEFYLHLRARIISVDIVMNISIILVQDFVNDKVFFMVINDGKLYREMD